jgi:hypothetical protein
MRKPDYEDELKKLWLFGYAKVIQPKTGAMLKINVDGCEHMTANTARGFVECVNQAIALAEELEKEG